MPSNKPALPSRNVFLLKFGIAAFVVLILFFYFLNLQNIWEINSQTTRTEESIDWQQIKTDFSSTMSQVNNRFDEAKRKQVAQASDALLDKLVANINQEASSSLETQANLLASSTLNKLAINSTSSVVLESTSTLNLLEVKLELKNKK